MKLRVVLEVEVSESLAATMQRNGFVVCRDGSAMQVRVPHAPAIPKRKTRVVFTENPADQLEPKT